MTKTADDYAEDFRSMHPRELAAITSAAATVSAEYIKMLSGDAQLPLPAVAQTPKGPGRPKGSPNRTKAEQMADAAAEEAEAIAANGTHIAAE